LNLLYYNPKSKRQFFQFRITSKTMRRLPVVKYAESVPLANVGE